MMPRRCSRQAIPSSSRAKPLHHRRGACRQRRRPNSSGIVCCRPDTGKDLQHCSRRPATGASRGDLEARRRLQVAGVAEDPRRGRNSIDDLRAEPPTATRTNASAASSSFFERRSTPCRRSSRPRSPSSASFEDSGAIREAHRETARATWPQCIDDLYAALAFPRRFDGAAPMALDHRSGCRRPHCRSG